MAVEERRAPAVGAQVKRWRTERSLTLANVAERTGLNVGYLSQIENDKASPSLACLGLLGDALSVPPAWFLITEVPAPQVVRHSERPVHVSEFGRMERVDGGVSRDVSVVEAIARPGLLSGEAHAHAGDEHHVVLRGRFRLSQGGHTVDLGPGDYLRWDGTIPHSAEVLGDEEGAMLIMRLHRQADTDWEPAPRPDRTRPKSR